MVCYIDENEAKKDIEAAAKAATMDYRLFVRKRELLDFNTKSVEFALLTKEEFSSDAFDILAKKRRENGDKLSSISSGILLDESQRVIKDMILIKAKVNCE